MTAVALLVAETTMTQFFSQLPGADLRVPHSCWTLKTLNLYCVGENFALQLD